MGLRLFIVWMGVVAALSMVGAGCAGCGSDPTGEGTLDAGDRLPDAAPQTRDLGGVRTDSSVVNPFSDADSLSCPQLDLLWHQQQDLIATHLRTCEQSSDCVLVETAIDCKPISGEEINVAGCDSAVAAEHEATWLADNGALGRFLCAERTLGCVSASLCPAVLTAHCTGGVCGVH